MNMLLTQLFRRLSTSSRNTLTKPATSTSTSTSTTPSSATSYNVPYFIHRTRLARQLPVYTDYRAKNTRVFTTLRRIEGNGQVLVKEIQSTFPSWKLTYNSTCNTITINGNVAFELRNYLTKKGF